MLISICVVVVPATCRLFFFCEGRHHLRISVINSNWLRRILMHDHCFFISCHFVLELKSLNQVNSYKLADQQTSVIFIQS